MEQYNKEAKIAFAVCSWMFLKLRYYTEDLSKKKEFTIEIENAVSY